MDEIMRDAGASPEPKRVNGFAEGDRVGIVNCELAGAYGKVVESWGGCRSEWCVKHCRIVYVRLMKIPGGIEPDRFRRSFTPNEDNIYRFKVNEVTHID